MAILFSKQDLKIQNPSICSFQMLYFLEMRSMKAKSKLFNVLSCSEWICYQQQQLNDHWYILEAILKDIASKLKISSYVGYLPLSSESFTGNATTCSG